MGLCLEDGVWSGADALCQAKKNKEETQEKGTCRTDCGRAALRDAGERGVFVMLSALVYFSQRHAWRQSYRVSCICLYYHMQN